MKKNLLLIMFSVMMLAVAHGQVVIPYNDATPTIDGAGSESVWSGLNVYTPVVVMDAQEDDYSENGGKAQQENPAGEWRAFHDGECIYFLVKVNYTAEPANTQDATHYYAGDGVEIFLAKGTTAMQYGFGYAEGTPKTYASATATSVRSKITKDAAANCWYLEVAIPLTGLYTGDITSNAKIKMELAINQSTTGAKRSAQILTWNNSSTHYSSTAKYTSISLDPTPSAEPVSINATCADVTFDGKKEDAIWNSKFAPVFEVVAAESGITMASDFSDGVNPLGAIQTNTDNCLARTTVDAECTTGLNKGTKVAEWQVLKRGVNEDAKADTLYLIVKVFDKDPVLNTGDWKSDAVELYLLVDNGGTKQINQYFIRYNELSETTHFGNYDEIINLSQSQDSESWTIEFALVSGGSTTIAGLDQATPNIKAELAVDVVNSGCDCRLGQVFTWRRGEYNWSALATDEEKQSAINRLKTMNIVEAPKTQAAYNVCSYVVTATGMDLARVEQKTESDNVWLPADPEESGEFFPTESSYYRAVDADGVVACPTELLNVIPKLTVTEEDCAYKITLNVGDGTTPAEVQFVQKAEGETEWKEATANEDGNYAAETKVYYSALYKQNYVCPTELMDVPKCPSLAIPTVIDLGDEELSIFKPFKPASDVADKFNTYEEPEKVEISIFNRAGVMVYNWEGQYDIDNAKWWNGCWKNDKDKKVDPGVYFYHLKFDNTSIKGAIEVVNSNAE